MNEEFAWFRGGIKKNSLYCVVTVSVHVLFVPFFLYFAPSDNILISYVDCVYFE